ncbi:hypothetical protein [Ehrlichia canis]|uniref:Uncharacterized protein n=1 Tax=Ehrlichia canis (strain Jake) TaxID=269484 RepID=A0ACA6AW69_EHRCJ|nr:hypothetical protein [Ehrlichia canis]AAZ68758.1 hypothetical protein Ecaj_0726 [Ehrlichia canis str. Jake]AUO54513.1 hypothetical protein C1I72_01160 [Ehrlichia canis]UKC53538.1 hypothetical protein s20019040002_000581 [Ehrlichia canis]UKC54476.1 hypothetical protein s20026770001_000582 [Ehrlichia canis]UKC55412.1 hypothetical protein s21009500007_000582 [Ehrlichia canis]
MDTQLIIIILLAIFSFLFALFIAVSIYKCCVSCNDIKEDYKEECVEGDIQKELELLKQRNKELEDTVRKLNTELIISRADFQKQCSEMTKSLKDMSNIDNLTIEVAVLHKNLIDFAKRMESDLTKSSSEKLQCLSSEILLKLYQFCHSVLIRGQRNVKNEAMAQDLEHVQKIMFSIITQLTERQQLQTEEVSPEHQVHSTSVSSYGARNINQIE